MFALFSIHKYGKKVLMAKQGLIFCNPVISLDMTVNGMDRVNKIWKVHFIFSRG